MRKFLSMFTMVVFSMLAYIANAGNYAITVDDASKVMAFAFHEDYSQDLLALEDGENVFEFNDGDQLLINSMNPEEPIRKVLIDGEEMEDEWGDWFINLTDGMRIDIITMDEPVEPEKAMFTIKVDQPEKVAAYYMQGAVDIKLEAGEHEYEIGNYERVNIEPIDPADPIYQVIVNGQVVDGGAYNNWSIILEDGLYIEIIVEGEPVVEPTIPTCVITVDNASKVLAWISDDWTSPLALQDGDNTISFTEGAYMLIMSSDPETESVYRVLVDGIQVGEDNDYDYEVDLFDSIRIEILTSDETSVESGYAYDVDHQIFRLDGTKVPSYQELLENGIYVVNGKKMVIRK